MNLPAQKGIHPFDFNDPIASPLADSKNRKVSVVQFVSSGTV